MGRKRKYYCCICGKEMGDSLFTRKNPKPVKDTGFCCEECYNEKVYPERLNSTEIIQTVVFMVHYEYLINDVIEKLKSFMDIIDYKVKYEYDEIDKYPYLVIRYKLTGKDCVPISEFKDVFYSYDMYRILENVCGRYQPLRTNFRDDRWDFPVGVLRIAYTIGATHCHGIGPILTERIEDFLKYVYNVDTIEKQYLENLHYPEFIL